MIHLCTCTGGSASTIGSTERRATTLCKICGGKLLDDGIGSPSSSRFCTVGLELTSFINPDLAWKKVSKGNRSSSRRARKSVEANSQAFEKLVIKDSKELEMPVSESEKLGVSVLGCRFSEKAEHVPIKKRRFLFRSPSPPPKLPSPRLEETERFVKSEHASGQGFYPNPVAKHQATAYASAVDLGQIVDSDHNIDRNKPVNPNKQIGDIEDFSGISILAAAACSESLGGDSNHVEEASGVDSSGRDPFGGLTSNESKEDFVKSAEISTDGTGSCISSAPPEGAASLRMDKSSPKSLPPENISERTSLQVNSAAASHCLIRKDEGTVRPQESSARDERLYWDLNTVMDAWKCPFDSQHETSPTSAAESVLECAEDVKHTDKEGNLEGHELQGELGGTNGNTENTQLSGESINLAQETQSSKVEKHELLSCEIDNTANVVVDRVQDPISFHSEERFSPVAESIASVSHKSASQQPTSVTIDEYTSTKCAKLSITSSESLSSCQVAGVESSVDYSLPDESNYLRSTFLSEENCYAPSAVAGRVKNSGDYDTDFHTGGTISSSSQAEKQNVSLPNVPLLDKAACKIGNILNESGGDAGLHDFGNPLKNTVDMETGISLGNVSLPNVHLLDKAAGKIGNILNENRRDDAGLHDSVNPLKNTVVMEIDIALGNEPLDDVKESAIFESDKGMLSHSCGTHPEMTDSFARLEAQPAVAVEGEVYQGKVSSGYDTYETHCQVNIDAEKRPSTSSLGKSMALLRPCNGLSSPNPHRNCSDDVINSSSREEHLDDGYNSDVFVGDLHPCSGIDKENELQVDYDSQYEDGELRESNIHAWEVYEDGETEHLDYESDNRDTNNFGYENAREINSLTSTGGSSRTKIADAESDGGSAVKISTLCLRAQKAEKIDSSEKGCGSGTENVIRASEDHDRWDGVKESNKSTELKLKMSGWDRLPADFNNSSDTKTRVRDGSIRNTLSGDNKDVLEAEDMETKIDGSRSYRRELPSRVERPEFHSGILRRDKLYVQRSSFYDADDAKPRPDFRRESGTFKPFGRGRYSLHLHARGQEGDRWIDSPENDRVLNRHRSPIYHRHTSFPRSGPEDVASEVNYPKHGIIPNAAGRLTASSHAMRGYIRRGTASDRQESFCMRLGFRPSREVRPDRGMAVGRGRSIRYVDGGGPKRRYYGAANDDCIRSSEYSHPFVRSRRSFSPIERRGSPHARRSNSRSPPRSKTRSPVAWQSPRGRNGDGVTGVVGLRHRSRSPNCGSDARISRARSPHPRSGIAADHVSGFMSVPRSHGSPPPKSRWIGYKHRSAFDRRSPGSIGPREGRFDLLDAPRNLNTNEYYRSVHPGRFSEIHGVGRGGHRYVGNDDERSKHGYRYGFVHPGRRYDMDGSVKRFRRDDDGFASAPDTRNKDAADFHGRGNPKAYSRYESKIADIPRSSREDRGSFIYRREGKDNADSKSFGRVEGDDDEASRSKRPS